MEREQPALEAAAKPKKPYEKPAFRYECVFETMALMCGKVTAGGTCTGQNKKAS